MVEWWQNRRIIACVGTGGVGKTTVAASIAVAAAARGMRTLVMTIDPARRLANALGVADFGNTEREITAEQLDAFGVTLRAPLWVMMPEVKRTFDSLIERTAPDEGAAKRILLNRFYQHFSNALAGSHEYAAVEKLYEVYSEQRYDLIVLDTPPSQNAVEFFDAPTRIVDFMDNETLQWLLKPYLSGGRLSRLLDMGSSFVLGTLTKMIGGETLRDIAEFLLSMRDMYSGFSDRSSRVRALLTSEEMAFVLVTGTKSTQQRATLRFRRDLQRAGIGVDAVVVNRARTAIVEPRVERDFDLYVRQNLSDLAPQVVEQVLSTSFDEIRLAQMDAAAIASLRRRVQPTPLLVLPELRLDIHDLSGLTELYRHLSTQLDYGASRSTGTQKPLVDSTSATDDSRLVE